MATTSLTVNPIRVQVGWEYTNTSDISGQNATFANSLTYSDTLSDGTGADQAKIIYAKESTSIDAAGNLTIDVESTTTDVYGNALNYELLKLIYIEHRTPAASDACAITGTALTAGTRKVLAGTGPSLNLRPGGIFFIYTPDANAYGPMAAGSVETVIVTNNAAAAVSVQVLLIGTK